MRTMLAHNPHYRIEFKVDLEKVAEAEQFRQGIIDLDWWAYEAYRELKKSDSLPVDYLVNIGMSKNIQLLSCVRELYRLYQAIKPKWSNIDEFSKNRELSRKDQDIEEREGFNWPGKYYRCYQNWDYVVVATRVTPQNGKTGCWRYWISLSKKEDPLFYEFCQKMPLSDKNY